MSSWILEVRPSLARLFPPSSFCPFALIDSPNLQWAYDNVTAEYCLSLQRKRKGHSIKLPANKGKVPAERRDQRLSPAPLESASSRSLLRVANSDQLTFGSTLNLAGSGENLHLAPVREEAPLVHGALLTYFRPTPPQLTCIVFFLSPLDPTCKCRALSKI